MCLSPCSRQQIRGREGDGGEKGTYWLSLKRVASSCFVTLSPTWHCIEISVMVTSNGRGDTDLILEGHTLSFKVGEGEENGCQGTASNLPPRPWTLPLAFPTLPQTLNICSHLTDIHYTLALPIIDKVYKKNHSS